MKNCLVIQLAEEVNNQNLPKLEEYIVDYISMFKNLEKIPFDFPNKYGIATLNNDAYLNKTVKTVAVEVSVGGSLSIFKGVKPNGALTLLAETTVSAGVNFIDIPDTVFGANEVVVFGKQGDTAQVNIVKLNAEPLNYCYGWNKEGIGYQEVFDTHYAVVFGLLG